MFPKSYVVLPSWIKLDDVVDVTDKGTVILVSSKSHTPGFGKVIVTYCGQCSKQIDPFGTWNYCPFCGNKLQ